MPGDGMAAFERWRQTVTSADANTEAPVDWEAFESSIGLRLPTDYKAYLDVYGVGCVNDLLCVRHPTVEKGAYNLLRAPTGENRHLLSSSPLRLGIGRDRLMLCADGEGNQLYWNTSDTDPDKWPVVLGDDSGRAWLAYDLTMVEFLLALFTGRLPDLGFAEAGFVDDEIVIECRPRNRR